MLVKNEYINELLDWYENLLTPKQVEIMNLYYKEDLSLAEIADYLHITRSAVYDQLKRTEKALVSYEERLHLVVQFKKRNEIYQELEKRAGSDLQTLIKRLKELE